MKLRPSVSAVISVSALPCSAALVANGTPLKPLWIIILVISLSWLIASAFIPSRMRKLYPSVAVIHRGCTLLRSYRCALIFHIVSFMLLKIILKITFLPSLMFWITALTGGFVLALGGTIRLLLRSTQLSFTARLALGLTFWIPIGNLFAIRRAEKTAWLEFDREAARIELDNARAENEICKTKYPILLVHGIFFRDLNFFNYWGRIPAELIKNGATIYYGKQRSAASVRDCGKELAKAIKNITETTGCEKVNIIAHSKGGLDARFAASLDGIGQHIASITTINTPHRGCEYADFLIGHAPPAVIKFISARYNAALTRFGEIGTDFFAGVSDLTAKHCDDLAFFAPLPDGIFCQSYGSYMKGHASAGFPQNLTYSLVKLFSNSPNDGLVALDSMRFGESFTVFSPKGTRGISHGDMIDLFREDIHGFDVREEFVKIAEGLKIRGL